MGSVVVGLIWSGIAVAGALTAASAPAAASVGDITTVAGAGAGDGRQATAVGLYAVDGVAVDAGGNVYIAERLNHRVRRVDALTGAISTIAGSGEYNTTGNGGPAVAAAFVGPIGLAAGTIDNSLYVGDGTSVRKIDLATGIITRVAGGGNALGDGGLATAARLQDIAAISLDAAGNLYIADRADNRVRRVTTSTGLIDTVAGTGAAGNSGDGALATSATLNGPEGVAVDSAGNIYIADTANRRVRVVDTTGTINAFAGTGAGGPVGDGGPALAASLKHPGELAVNGTSLLIADDQDSRVRIVTGATITTFAGTGVSSVGGDGQPAVQAGIARPKRVTVDAAGTVFVGDYTGSQVRTFAAAAPHTAGTVAGDGTNGYSGDGGPATAALLGGPTDAVALSNGDIVFCDPQANVVRRISVATGKISTFAGTGVRGFSGDGLLATNASLSSPSALGVDGDDTVYVSDVQNARIRKITADGVISTIAGTGSFQHSGDNGPATAANILWVNGIVMTSTGDLLLTENGSRVRRIDHTTNTITTIAGTGANSDSGDGGPALAASFKYAYDVAVDSTDNIVVLDASARKVRRIDAVTGLITTVAGTGVYGTSGDGGAAIAASFAHPFGLVVDGADNLFITDEVGQRVRRIDALTHTITTSAGTGTAGFFGDNGPGVAARLLGPEGITVDRLGNVYVADTGNQRIRKIEGAAVAFVPPSPPAPPVDPPVTDPPQIDPPPTVPPATAPPVVDPGVTDPTGPTAADSPNYRPVQPDRLLDTRLGIGAPSAPLGAGQTLVLQVSAAGATNVPLDASAVVLNVTVTNPTAPGYVTAWPCGQPRPTASNLNYVAGQTTPNLVVVKLGEAGSVCLYSQSTTDLLADVNGWYPAGNELVSVQPERLLDTRFGIGAPAEPVAADATLSLQVTGAGETQVPSAAAAVVLNITATNPIAAGYVTVWPCGQPRPLASNLNIVRGRSTPNLAIVKLGEGGTVCLYSQSITDLLADIDGWYPAGSDLTSVQPERLLDTRTGTGAPASPLTADGLITLQVTGAGQTSVPTDANAVVLNVTVTNPAAPGYVTVWPCGQPRPTASNLNYVADQTIPNLAIVKLGEDGTVCVYSQSATDLIADVSGWYLR